MPEVSVIPSGEAALRVTGATGDRELDWRLVHGLSREIVARDVAGIHGCIPTYESTLIEFDPMTVTVDSVAELVTSALGQLDLDAPLRADPRHFDVPVLYGGEGGPDLDEVARIAGIPVDDVIALHTEPTYTIRCLGAPGGSPMLDGPAFGVPIPRLASPRPHVPQGAVSVAGRQATLTPAAAPGGWCVIGHTPHTVIDLDDPSLVPYAPGDTLRFRPVDAAEHARLVGTRLTAEDAR